MNLKIYFEQATEREASDIFITVGIPVSMKVDGQLVPLGEESLTPFQAKELIQGIMEERYIHELNETRECNFAVGIPGVGRFRCSAFWQRDSIGMVARRIVTEIPKVDDLGLPPILKDIIMSKRGLVLMVGATGTGKSTSLAALIDHRNHNSKGHILTIEDPIEFIHRHGSCMVTQREVGVDTRTFDDALKSSLRQAPDVILIGEIRSMETMEYAMSFADTGHLCVATLHANNANQAIERIMHLAPKELHSKLLFDLSLNLRAIVAQQLVPKKDEKGRVAAIEVLLNSPYVADLIHRNKTGELKDAMVKGKEQGMQTFDMALYSLYKEDRISLEQALHHADSPNDLRLMIKLSDDVEGKEESEEDSLGSLSNVSIDMD